VSSLPESAESLADFRPPDEQVRATLAGVIASDVFSTSPRLREFLLYVVEETLAGRGGRIKGKTIATDVYERELDADGGAQNLVRVEARRLRRLLAEYYDTEGHADRLRIQIDPGGYTPRFTTSERANVPADSLRGSLQKGGRHWLIPVLFSVAGLALILVAGAFSLKQGDERPVASGQPDEAIRQALRERSVPALQAVNLAQQARGLFFPVFDAKRQNLALGMYRHAIDLEPGLPHGYAGAAQVLTTLGMLSQDETQAARLQKEARGMADQALSLAPSDAWAHGASGWTLANAGAFEEALKHTRLAFKLAPQDGHLLDLVGITAIMVQEPELAAQASHPDRSRLGVGRFAARNIWGVSQLMLGDYRATVDAFSGAAAAGAPVSPPSLVFLAVAHDHLGNMAEARRLVDELSATWPDFPIAFLVRRIFHDRTPLARDIDQRLAKHGYVSATK